MKSAITFFFCLTVFTAFSQGRFPELPVPSTPGEMVQAMEKLNTVGSVLYLAAHPDDENTRMISWLASERKVRTAYLSLTRGDGGQNLIGTEKGEELGLLRTQELLEARRVDGGEQFFTRAKDFGYSKNPEESFEIWGRQQILADVVWVIRKFRPDVIICRFPTTGEGGHGHHTASAILAGEAFKLAADPKAFPEQLAYVKTWQAKRVLWNSFSWTRKPNEIFAGEIKVETGNYNPLLGRNYGEIAAMARSKHRCQGFGSKLSRGEVQEYVKNIAGDSITTDILERVDLSWNRVEGGAAIGTLIQQAVLGFDLHKPAASVPQLLRIRSAIEALKDEHWKRVKLEEVDQLILACSGIYFEATSAATELTPGSKFEINIEGINRSAVPVVLKEILVNDNRDSVWNKSLDNNQLFTAKRTVTLPSSFPVSQPNWLAMKEEKGIYAPKDTLKVDAPEIAPDLTITFVFDVSGV
ncbi:MAG: PIG-L family deacetylase, partial [Bacteroidota bacterium]